MAVLVCGGAGYIGSHTVAALKERNEEVIVIDNLTKGHKESIEGAKLYIGDIRNPNFLQDVFNKNTIEAVIDFAASIEVGESAKDPINYYDNNVGGVISLLRAMNNANCNKIVFSSTAAVYGQPKEIPILETAEKAPTNVYGNSKLASEQLLAWCEDAYGIRSVCLRYFNASGAHPSGKIGEDHNPETHLIPLVLQAAMQKRESITIFGDDYDTPDGSCIRDYVHVCDLADAHIKALDHLRTGAKSTQYNLGSGSGYSVKEVIEIATKVTQKDIKVIMGKRRIGDPAKLVASSAKIKTELNWSPQYDDLEKIIASAWSWHISHPNGY